MTETEIQEYEEFVQNHPRGHFTQSLEWAKLKKGWKHEVVIVRDENNKIKGSLLLLIRKMPIIKSTIVTSQRGPVCDLYDKKTFSELMKKVEEVCKKNHAFMFRMDPDVSNYDLKFKDMIKSAGFKVIEKVKDINRVVHPRVVFRLNLKDKTEDEIFAAFHSKTRYNVRLATKKGVVITEGKKEDIPELERLMKVTGERDGFPIRTKEYFEELYDVLGPKHFRITFAEYEGKKIAANVDFLYGDKVWYMYGASSNEQRNLMPTYLLQWDGIKWAIENHCNAYDFRGICAISLDDKNRNEGLYRFKNGFNPELIEFTEFYKVYNPILYFAFEKLFPLYRKIRVKLMGKKVNQN